MKKAILIALALILFLSVPVLALAGYLYYFDVTITNAGGTEVRARISMYLDPNGLINNNLMQADCDDLVLEVNGVATDILARDLSNTDCYWYTDWITVPADTAIRVRVNTGNTTVSGRDQNWICDANDTVTIANATHLNMTDELTLQGDFYFENIPDGNVTMIEKGKSYRLLMGNGTVYFLIDDSSTQIDVAEDTWYNIRATYDKVKLRLYLDGTLANDTAETANIAIGGEDVHIMEFDGKCDDLAIGNTSVVTPTFVGNFTMQPVRVTKTLIIDEAGYGNATYSFQYAEANPPGITTATVSLDPGDEARVTDAYTAVPVGFGPDAPGAIDGIYGNNSADWERLPGSSIVGVIAGVSDIPVSFLWYYILAFFLIVMTFVTYQYSHNTQVVMIVGMVGVFFCCVVFPIGWWIYIAYVLLGASIGAMEKAIGF